MDSRTADVERFWSTGQLDPSSNVQFGEGGAGTFSDGKLNTGIKNIRLRTVLEELYSHGAPENILIDAKPHIGTDILVNVVKNIRKEIISLGGIVTSKSLRVAGDELDQAIIAYVKKEFSLMIGERTAEQIKMELGSAYKIDDENASMDIKGRDMITGLPKIVTITEDQIREALKEPVYSIIESIKTTLEKTPPELSADIMEKGIMLAGGGALLKGLDKLINHETNMPVHIAETPLDCVVLGAGKALENFDELSKTQRGQ